jgi:CRISPR/Cas system-associated protein Csm6
MKVFEILRNDVKLVSEQQVAERLKNFDWKYEFSDDTSRMVRGEREMQVLENIVYQFWKTNPDKAVALWNKYQPGVTNPDIVPSFIFRLQAQE